MPLTPPAPYDTLATVTALTRVILADFVQNIQPNNNGTVTVDATGYIVTWTAGNQFSALMNGAPILVNGLPNVVAAVTSPTSLALVNQAVSGAGLSYQIVIPTGDFYADAQAYVVPITNLAWRKLQKKLADRGHPRLEGEVSLFNLPVVANLDPISQCFVSWTEFFDGANTWTAAEPPPGGPCPLLPPDFIAPLHLKERFSVQAAVGTVNYNRLRDMHPAPNSLRQRQKGCWNREWDWREDAIYFPGAIVPMDLWMRYNAFLPDLVPAAGGFGATPVEIPRCAESLAYYSAAIFVEPRGGGLLVAGYEQKGDMALDQITNQYAKLQQRASYSRKPWGRRYRRGGLRTM